MVSTKMAMSVHWPAVLSLCGTTIGHSITFGDKDQKLPPYQNPNKRVPICPTTKNAIQYPILHYQHHSSTTQQLM